MSSISMQDNRAASPFSPSLLVFSPRKGCLLGLPLRATFSPAHPLADIFHPPYPPIASQSISRDVPLSQTRAFQSPSPLVKGVAKAALYCAHRTSTVSPCAFCEQEGHMAAPSPSFRDRALRKHRRPSVSILSLPFRTCSFAVWRTGEILNF